MLTGPCQLSRGDHVIVLLPKVPQWWLLNIACARAGITIIALLLFWKKKLYPGNKDEGLKTS